MRREGDTRLSPGATQGRESFNLATRGGAGRAAAARATGGSESPSVPGPGYSDERSAVAVREERDRAAGGEEPGDEPAGVIGYHEKEEKQARCVSGVERRSTGRQEERTK